jgi:hypothetical protein
MNSRIRSIPLYAALAFGLVPIAANADDAPASVTVSFGAGMNTAQVGNPANHHVMPKTIRVRKGGTVNFVVAGFHQIFVYKPGTKYSIPELR